MDFSDFFLEMQFDALRLGLAKSRVNKNPRCVLIKETRPNELVTFRMQFGFFLGPLDGEGST